MEKVLEKFEKAKIETKPTPGETYSRISVWLMNEIQLSSSKNEYVILIPFPISKSTYQNIRHHVRKMSPTLEMDISNTDGLEHMALFMESDVKEGFRSKAAFSREEGTLIRRSVRFSIKPRLIPYLSIPIPIVKEGQGQRD